MKSIPPEQFRLTHEMAARRGLNPMIGSDASFGRNGMFIVPFEKILLRCMISDGADEAGEIGAWEHVSVSLSHRCPTWEEMCFVKNLFFDKHEVCVQFHPAEEDYVNNHQFCLHLWRPKSAVIPTPPPILVGLKGVRLR